LFGDITVICVTQHLSDGPNDRPIFVLHLSKLVLTAQRGSHSCSTLITYIAVFYCPKNEIITMLHAMDFEWKREGITL